MQKIAGFGEACHVTAVAGQNFALRAVIFKFRRVKADYEQRLLMTTSPHEFVQTGQTFTSDGAAYCPVERKRRGALALAASLGVLFVGAGFLTYAMMSTPAPVVERSSDMAAAPSTPSEAPNDQIAELLAEPDMAIATEPKRQPLTVEQALAESRAARAGVTIGFDEVIETELAPRLNPKRFAKAPTSLAPPTQTPRDKDGLTPSLNPRLQKTASTIKGAAPSLKPSVETRTLPAPTAHARPAKIGGFAIAAEADAPPSFFFASDIERTQRDTTPAPVLYAGDISEAFREIRIRITKGENFVDALKRAGVSANDRNDAAYAFGKHYNLRRLRPGQEFLLTVGQPQQTLFQIASASGKTDARLLALEFRADAENRIFVRRDHTGKLAGEAAPIALTTRVLSVAGRIDGSLYLSAKASGAPDQIIADLADAFAYDVDFQREIFGGDEFEAIFEARYDDQGDLVSTGDIIYARLYWRGRSKEKGYYRFAGSEDGKRGDYYDAAGQGAKRLLMKTPIDGARLSSRFGTRKHPILGYRRAHKGVDFAAPRGTPIKAAGDGVVERADRYGSFGNYIRIRHANGYKTAYAHLKSFRRGVRKGKRVRQGDIIGYVGTTGRSTGPHLHYEVHLKGKAVNPQKLKIATGKQLRGADLDRFKIQRDLINAMRLPPEEPSPLLAKDDRDDKSAL